MSRYLPWILLTLIAAQQGEPPQPAAERPPARPADPVRYDLLLNGESFSLEANRAVTLTSAEHPGTKYEVALRIAQLQPLRLNSVELEYDRGFAVTEDRGQDVRTATFEHNLGFGLTLTDYGAPLPAEAVKTVLDTHRDLREKLYRGASATDIKVSQPFEKKLKQATAQGVTITCTDDDGFGLTSLVLVLEGETFCCACLVEMFDADKEDALPLVERLLDSIQARAR